MNKYKSITERMKAIEQLERYAKSESPTITISNTNRFSPGFRDRLTAFFVNEIELEMEDLEAEIIKVRQ